MQNNDNESLEKSQRQKIEDEILEVFAEIEKAFPQFTKDRSEAGNKLDLWVRYIGWKFTKATMMKAVAAQIQESRFAPAVSDIYQLCKRFAGSGDRGGMQKNQECLIDEADYLRQMEAEGLTQIKISSGQNVILVTEKKSNCVKIGNKYIPKVDFAMNRCSPKTVTEAIHESVSDDLSAFERRSPMALAMKIAVNKKLAAKVRKTISDLVEISKEPVQI